MVKQIILPIIAVALFIVAVGLFSKNASSLNLTALIATPTPGPSMQMKIGGKTIQAEIVSTSEARNRGLSGRTTLTDDQGMLFVFDSKKVNASFWMKGMKMPIDIIWIRDGRIEKIDEEVPPPAPGIADRDLKTYSADRSIDYVLEVRSGFSKKYGLKTGETIELPNGYN